MLAAIPRYILNRMDGGPSDSFHDVVTVKNPGMEVEEWGNRAVLMFSTRRAAHKYVDVNHPGAFVSGRISHNGDLTVWIQDCLDHQRAAYAIVDIKRDNQTSPASGFLLKAAIEALEAGKNSVDVFDIQLLRPGVSDT